MPVRTDPNFGFLLAGILGVLLVGPLADQIFADAKSLILMLAYSSMLVVGIWSLQASRRLFFVGVGLVVISIGISLLNSIANNPSLGLASLAVLMAFESISIYLAIEYLLSPGDISFNRLIGAVCTYLLIGMVFAGLYFYLVAFDPESFSGIDIERRADVYWDMTYFSFVTLTTLGYGDILPVGQAARALAHLEASTGTLFIAILIGLLVGSYFRDTTGPQD